MLQLLLEYRGFSEVFRENNWRYDNIAEALGLPSEMENSDDFCAKVKKLLQGRNKTLLNWAFALKDNHLVFCSF